MFRYLSLILLFLMLGGCSPKQPNIDFDPNFATASLETYTIIPISKKDANTLDYERIHEAIISEMKMKGYTYTSKDSGDFHIAFKSHIKEDVPSNVSFGFGFGTFSKNIGTSISTSHNVSKNEVDMFIKMIDPKTKKTFWRTAFTKDIAESASAKEKTAYFKKIVATMLKEFPSTKE